MREAPVTLLPKLFKAWNISHLVFEKDTDAYARERDLEVTNLAKKAGVEVIVKVGRTLYDPDALVEKNHGKPTMSISQVQQVRLLDFLPTTTNTLKGWQINWQNPTSHTSTTLNSGPRRYSS